MINVKDLFRFDDPTITSPRRFKDADTTKGSGVIGKGNGRNKINSTQVLEGLTDIAREYEEAVQAKAKEYADGKYSLDADSDEELREKAKEATEEIYRGKKESFADTRDAKTAALTAQKGEVGADRAAALRNLKKSYGKAESGLLESLSRQGLMRSSIGDLSRESLLAEQREAVQRTEERFDKKVAILDRKIEQANAAYESALKNYEIDYAIRMENKLARLQNERDRAVQAYEREHSEEKEKAYNAYLFQTEAENQRYEKEHADYTGDKKANYQARYKYLVDTLSAYDKTAVADFLSQNEAILQKYLGLYYDRFVKEVS